jgi:hypothetical protein
MSDTHVGFRPEFLFLLLILFTLVISGCGRNCDDVPELTATLEPDSIAAGSGATVVVSFQEAVFDTPGSEVRTWLVDIRDVGGEASIGSYDDSVFGMEYGYAPDVSGVAVSGGLVDDRSFEVRIEMPAGTEPGFYPVQAVASNDGVECYKYSFDEVLLQVTQ